MTLHKTVTKQYSYEVASALNTGAGGNLVHCVYILSASSSLRYERTIFRIEEFILLGFNAIYFGRSPPTIGKRD
jgi:hypothetical protein